MPPRAGQSVRPTLSPPQSKSLSHLPFKTYARPYAIPTDRISLFIKDLITIEFDSLRALGWSDRLQESVAKIDVADDARIGRVGRVDRGEVTVFVPEGTLRAMSDSQRAQDVVAPATGDWVVVGDEPELGLVVQAIVPRSSALTRRDPAEQVVEQVIVANIDVVAIVHGLDREVNPAQLERFLILAWDSGARPIIVLSKADLVGGDKQLVAATSAAAVADDVPVYVTSAVAGTGLEPVLAEFADGRTIVLLGQSGVGKSELVNGMVGEQLQATGEVREGDAKGRHTTTRRELIGPLENGGIVIDTPGIRAVGVWDADLALDRVFSDIVETAEDCRFRDCTHRSEPNCAVRSAVEAGDIDPDRLDRYLRLWDEITHQSLEAEERARKARRGRRRST